MCSFLLTNALIFRLAFLNRFMKLRGPDATTVVEVEGITFLHNLLHMVGERRLQPLRGGSTRDRRVLAVFNGEIYNYKELDPTAKSDGDALLQAYLRWGPEFVRRLHGEFALVIADLEQRRFIVAVDTFGTKPLFYGRTEDSGVARSDGRVGGAFGVASYRSTLAKVLGAEAVRPVPPNTFLVLDEHFHVLQRRTVFEFDLRQFRTSWETWQATFHTAVLQRAGTAQRSSEREHDVEPVFLGVSSGYDSGALYCAVLQLCLNHTAYTVSAREDSDLVWLRMLFASDLAKTQHECQGEFRVLQMSQESVRRESAWLIGVIEYFKYTTLRVNPHGKGMERVMWGANTVDPAAVGLSAICRDAQARGAHRVMLSAAGGDEVFSDYGYLGQGDHREADGGNASFGRFFGFFPDTLVEIFPWQNFYLGNQRNYLMKEESVAGAHGIETRYPYLDVRLVQEFLWLNQDLKNRHYKSPSHVFMNQANFPLQVPMPVAKEAMMDFREGFSASAGLLESRAAVVTDFSIHSSCSSSMHTCWARARARASNVRLAAKWRSDALHGCAIGTARILEVAFRRCKAQYLNATEIDGSAQACAETYLLAKGVRGKTCLELLRQAGDPMNVIRALKVISSFGLCHSSTCVCHAIWYWGLKADILEEVRTRYEFSIGPCHSSSSLMAFPESNTIDRQCAITFKHRGGLEGSRTNCERSLANDHCALDFKSHAHDYVFRSGLAVSLIMDASVDRRGYLEDCLAVRGIVHEVWVNLRGHRLKFSRARSGRRVEEERFLVCLPASCRSTSASVRKDVVWHQFFIAAFFVWIPEESTPEAPSNDDMTVTPVAPFGKLLWHQELILPAQQTQLFSGVRLHGDALALWCTIDFWEHAQGLREVNTKIRHDLVHTSDKEFGEITFGWQDFCNLERGQMAKMKVDIVKYFRRNSKSESLERLRKGIEARGIHLAAIAPAVLCLPASCMRNLTGMNLQVAWNMFLDMQLGIASSKTYSAPRLLRHEASLRPMFISA